LEDALQEITDMLMEMAKNLMEEDINYYDFYKGHRDKTAANFLVEMGGDITRLNVPAKSLPWRDWTRLFTSPVNMKAEAG